MTALEQDTMLKNFLGDPNGYKWDHDKRIEALNVAGDEIVNMIIGMSQAERKGFDHLHDLMQKATISVTDGSDGYQLSGLAGTDNGEMFSEAGFVRAECTLDGSKRRCVRYPAHMEGVQSNQYLAGNDEYPVIRFEDGYVNIDVTSGSYPVSVDMYYIRTPKLLMTDGAGASDYETTTSELPPSLHRQQVRLAEAYCRRMADDFEQYGTIYQEVMQSISLVVTGNMTAQRGDESTGQHRR